MQKDKLLSYLAVIPNCRTYEEVTAVELGALRVYIADDISLADYTRVYNAVSSVIRSKRW